MTHAYGTIRTNYRGVEIVYRDVQRNSCWLVVGHDGKEYTSFSVARRAVDKILDKPFIQFKALAFDGWKVTRMTAKKYSNGMYSGPAEDGRNLNVHEGNIYSDTPANRKIMRAICAAHNAARRLESKRNGLYKKLVNASWEDKNRE